MVSISLRFEQELPPEQLILETQFDVLEEDTLQPALTRFTEMDTSILRRGLEHRNPQVRLKTLDELLHRNELDYRTLEQLLGDNLLSIRNKTIYALEGLGRTFSHEEAKGILVRTRSQQNRGLLGSLSTNRPDMQGAELYQHYIAHTLNKLSEDELTTMTNRSLVYDDAPYFVRAEMAFTKHSETLRADVDDNFQRYFNGQMQRTELLYGDGTAWADLFAKSRGIEDFLRKQLTRQGLNILSRKKKRDDLSRMRQNMDSGYAGVSVLDVQYISKFGDLEDMVRLGSVGPPHFGIDFAAYATFGEFQRVVANAILHISRKRPIMEALSLPVPVGLLSKLIELCSLSQFKKISHGALLELFDHESPEIRRAAAIKAVTALPARRIRQLLSEYVLSDKYRYYNVIHWLDMGASLSRVDAKEVARAAADWKT